jgi:predicted ArsR family transcriptional regulator
MSWKKGKKRDPRSGMQKGHRVTDVYTFIEVWQTSSSVEAVSKALGVTESAVHSRVVRLRKKGVPLKVMQKMGRPMYDYGLLALHAESFVKKTKKKGKK